MDTIVIGVVAFTAVILALVLILLLAKARLVASGDVKILINDDPSKRRSVATTWRRGGGPIPRWTRQPGRSTRSSGAAA